MNRFLFILFISFPQLSLGYDFVVKKNEFNLWDEKCKALYISTQVGQKSEFSRALPKSIVSRYRREADAIKSGGWHYCAGLIYFYRAKIESDLKLRKRNLNKALEEVKFSARQVSPKSPEFLEMNVYLGNVYLERGEYKQALAAYDLVIKSESNYVPAYTAKSIWFKKQGKVNEAIELLEGMNSELKNNSAEVNYFLGILYFEIKNFEQAAQKASIAYGLGYPLPGLKYLLKDKNVSIPDYP